MRIHRLFFRSLFLVVSIAVLAGPAHAVDRYVGTCGPCTFATISAAVAASSGGDTIYVTGGAYVETVDLNTMASKGDINLFALGAVTITPSGDEGIKFNLSDNGGVHFPGNISITGFTFDVSVGSFGVLLLGVAGNVTVSRCTANDFSGVGIQLSNVDGNITVDGFTANKVVGVGIHVGFSAGDLTITDVGSSNGVGLAVYLSDIDVGRVSIIGCTMSDWTGGAVYLEANSEIGDLLVQNCNITNNSFAFHIISLSSTSANVLRCNNIQGNAVGVVLTDGGYDVDAAQNWWGDASGPTHPDNIGEAGIQLKKMLLIPAV